MNFPRLATALLILSLPWTAAAAESARQPRAVVELFTSQGCSSCPPADELLGELAVSGDVVALAYHVDYWDYLGWRDTLASPDNTARQYEYSRAFGNRMVYTPQAIVNGRQQMNGAKRGKVENAIRRMAGTAEGMSVDLDVRRSGDSLVIETGPATRAAGDAQVVLVYFHPATRVEIDRGRNTGRSHTFVNAVSGFHAVGMWHGEAARFELPASEIARKGAGGSVVLLQQVGKNGLPGAILGAALVGPATGW